MIGIFNAAFGLAFTVVMFMQMDQVEMLARAKGQQLLMFAVSNCLLYIFTATQSFYIIRKLNSENLRVMSCRHQVINFCIFLFTFSGIGIVWSKEMQKIEKE